MNSCGRLACFLLALLDNFVVASTSAKVKLISNLYIKSKVIGLDNPELEKLVISSGGQLSDVENTKRSQIGKILKKFKSEVWTEQEGCTDPVTGSFFRRYKAPLEEDIDFLQHREEVDYAGGQLWLVVDVPYRIAYSPPIEGAIRKNKTHYNPQTASIYVFKGEKVEDLPQAKKILP